MNNYYNLQSAEQENPVKDPTIPNNPNVPEPTIPEPSPEDPNPYPVTDPISEPNPESPSFPTPPEPIPTMPPDVIFQETHRINSIDCYR